METSCANTYSKEFHTPVLYNCASLDLMLFSTVFPFEAECDKTSLASGILWPLHLCTGSWECVPSASSPPWALISAHFASWRKVTGELAAIMAKITRPPCDYEMLDQRTSGTCVGLQHFFPCSTLGMVLRNVTWEEEDYTYWEIIWNYRPGFGIK